MPIGYLVPTPLEPHSPIHILLLTGASGIGKTTIIKWEVTRENRDGLPTRILAWLERRGWPE